MATIVTRSGKGSPLTHAEVDANFTNLNTDKLELSGGTMTGNLSFGDNDKAIFGAGSDLQIYHDGSDSYINEAGAGNLIVQTNGANIQLDGAAGEMARFKNGSSVDLYYNNALKLATTSTGVDITGTVTADGLTVDGSATASSGSINLNSTDPTVRFYDSNGVVDNRTFEWRGVGGSGFEGMYLRTINDAQTTFTNRLRIQPNGDISFYEDTGTTAKFFWDASAESLGIGTSSIYSTAVNRSALSVNGVTDAIISLGNGTTENGFLYANTSNTITGTRTATPYIFYTNNTERMRIDSSGNVGIGTSSPSYPLDVKTIAVNINESSGVRFGTNDQYSLRLTQYTTSGGAPYAEINGPKDNNGWLAFTTGTSDTERMRIDSSGNVGIGTSSPSERLHVSTVGSSGVQTAARFSSSTDASGCKIERDGSAWRLASQGALYLGADYDANGTAPSSLIAFETDATERMRIDSSGNLLVGKTSTNYNVTGVQAFNAGYLHATADGGNVVTVNRKTSDGDLVTFRKDGTTVGSIGTENGDFNIDGPASHSGLRFQAGSIMPRLNGVDSSGTIDLGYNDTVTTYAFKNLTLSGGIYLGGVGASNFLDDYEEGNWTPVTNSGSWTVNSAKYTKVGAMVTCTFDVTATSTISANDFTGLPFTPDINSAGVVGYQNSESGEVFGILVQSSSLWNFRVGSTQKGLANGSLARGTFTYVTAS